MDKWQALYSFWAQFGLETYDEGSVPDSADYPRLTYQGQTAAWQDGARVLTASLWYKEDGWESVQNKADEISEAIGLGGLMLPYDGGAMWIRRSNAFAQMASDPDKAIRRIVIQIEVEFISTN